MAKSYAQMADEIMNSTGMLSESGAHDVQVPSVHGEKALPELSNEQRAIFLGESNARIIAKKAMKGTLTGNETEREKRGGQAKINKSVPKQKKIGLDSAAKLYDSLGLTSEEAAILKEAHMIMQRILNERRVAEEMSDSEIDSIMNKSAERKFGKGSAQAKAHKAGRRNLPSRGDKPETPEDKAKAARDAQRAARSGGTGTQSTGTENSGQLPRMREMTSVGSIGVNMGGSANKAYDKDAKPMGHDTPPIAPVDSTLKKVNGKNGKKGKKAKAKKESFEYLLGSVLNDAQKKGWIQDAEADIEKRGTEGVCTGDKFGSASCPPGSKRYNLAKTFKKMGKKKKKGEK